MAVPGFQSFFKPLLEIAADGKDHFIKDAREEIAKKFALTEDDLVEMLPSGIQAKFANRVGWAKTYLIQAHVLEATGRGYFKITERGKQLLSQGHDRIDAKVLNQYPEFVEFRTIRREQSRTDDTSESDLSEEKEDKTPDELMDSGFNSIQASLAKEIIDKVRSNESTFFEKVVLDLLSSMDYGEGKVTGRSGDGGVDGFISQDKLGLDKIMFQAKRFSEGTVVTPSMVRDFLGALDIYKVSKGVFMTTSRFSAEAQEIVRKSQRSVVLIDGMRLAKLMIENDIGVSKEKSYEIKRIDTDYFTEE